jgi:2-polyprenyl-3-methyl-5-hydroxy-6-metoxy-1,4-benzoquinol methylase
MEHACCPICKSKRIQKLKKYNKHFLSSCVDCSFIFSYKIPDPEELFGLYNAYEHYGIHTYISPITIKRYDELLKGFEQYKKTSKMLDFGCGPGYFLDRAKLMGWETFGSEYNKKASKICSENGISMLENNQTGLNYNEQFDVILFSEVIEHLIYPSHYLKLFSDYLRPGGMIYITTPNYNSITRKILKSKWSVLGYPEHLSYFTSSTLKKALNNNNFKIIWTRTHGISLSQIKISLKKKRETVSYKNNEDEKIREITERNYLMKFLKNIGNKILTLFKIGDSIKCYAIKKEDKVISSKIIGD